MRRILFLGAVCLLLFTSTSVYGGIYNVTTTAGDTSVGSFRDAVNDLNTDAQASNIIGFGAGSAGTIALAASPANIEQNVVFVNNTGSLVTLSLTSAADDTVLYLDNGVTAFNMGTGIDIYGDYTNLTGVQGIYFADAAPTLVNGLNSDISVKTNLAEAFSVYALGSLTVNGNLNGTITAEAGGNEAHGIYAENGISMTGNINSNITSVAGGVAAGIQAQGSDFVLSGDLKGNIIATANTHYAYGIATANDFLMTGNIDSNINATATTGSVAFALMSGNDISLTGDINGNMLSVAGDTLSYTIFADNNINITGNIDGNVTARADGLGASCLYSDDASVNIIGNINGNLSAFADGQANTIQPETDFNMTGNINGNITANATDSLAQCVIADSVSITGDINGDMTAEANNAGAVVFYVNPGDITITGNINGDITANAFAGDMGYGFITAAGNINITGNINGDISAQAGGDMAYGIRSADDISIIGDINGDINTVAGNNLSVGIYATDILSITGDVNGNVTASAGNNSVRGLFSIGDLTVNGSINGNMNVSATSGDNVYAICSDANVLINGNLAGNIDVAAFDNPIAVYANTDLTVNGDVTGDITVNAGRMSAIGFYAGNGNILINGNLSSNMNLNAAASGGAYGFYNGTGDIAVTGNLSGDINVTGASQVAGVYAFTGSVNGGNATTPLDIGGNIFAQAGDNAYGVLSYDAMNLNVTGNITALSTVSPSTAYAIKSGRVGASQAVTDTVIIGGGATIIGKIDLAEGTDTLTLNGSSTIYNDILNVENLSKIGGGKASLNGNTNVGVNNVNITGGELAINGSLTADTVIIGEQGCLGGEGAIYANMNSAGLICGNPTINGDLISTGTIAPGNSIGTVTVNGNFTNSGDLEIEATQNSNDKIIVSGTATINGGNVELIFPEAQYLTATSYEFLQAANLVGEFAGVSDNNPMLDVCLNGGRAITTRKTYTEKLGSLNLNASASSVLNAFDNISYNASGIITTVLGKMDYMPAADLANFLEQLTSEKYDAYTETSYSLMDIFSTDKQDRLKYIRTTGEVGPYFKVIRKEENFEATADRTEFSPTMYGINIGNDAKLGDKVKAGLGVSYLQSDVDYSASFVNESEMDIFIFGIYGTYSLNDNWYLDSSVQAGTSKNRHLRRVIQSGNYVNSNTAYTINEEFSSEYRSKFAGALIETGYLYTLPKQIKLTPLVSLDASYISTEAFTESSTSPLALNVKDTGEQQVRFALGSVISKEFTLENKTVLLPELTLKWLHNFSDGTRNITASFNDIANSEFVSTSGSYKQDSLFVDIAMLIKSKETVSFKINYAERFASGRSSSEFSFDVNFKF